MQIIYCCGGDLVLQGLLWGFNPVKQNCYRSSILFLNLKSFLILTAEIIPNSVYYFLRVNIYMHLSFSGMYKSVLISTQAARQASWKPLQIGQKFLHIYLFLQLQTQNWCCKKYCTCSNSNTRSAYVNICGIRYQICNIDNIFKCTTIFLMLIWNGKSCPTVHRNLFHKGCICFPPICCEIYNHCNYDSNNPIRSGHKFAYVMTAELSWYTQYSDLINYHFPRKTKIDVCEIWIVSS